MPTTFTALFLGNLADIDTFEGNNSAENAGALVGLTFGTIANPLVDSAVTWSAVGNPGSIFDMDNSPADQFSVDGGPAQTFDGTAIYDATITYTDGSTATITAVLAQDVNGNTYLVPEFADNADQSSLEAGIIQSLTLDGLTGGGANFSGLTANRQDWQLVTCFTPGTMIETPKGPRLIEELQAGDKIRTLDNGNQPLRWIGRTTVRATGAFAPVLICAGALDNRRDLIVSPQHRMLIQGWRAELVTGHSQALVAAKHLVNNRDIRFAPGSEVTYIHLLFDRHEIIWAEGCPTESFHPGQMGWTGLEKEARDEILALFPELAANGMIAYGPLARPTIRKHEALLSVA
ncbi:Hint domain-containing protein [Ruegeria pomeroyi]|uniref:Hint domain-containing protein n=1 Tax=Ruegeria alba TaxID=2916756 RepID=A0ABS9NT42_9RHOB|nr:Hint domain-containing protein [Ruegeria alba]MCE8511644.1 Hint domain-containing protein [Ruegeria pomeroyi]MCE8520074.1 Hint domain-containing protein [Ruegeria pomeroyi]MCE8523798.1 Hint domain-containing protein [Ruegeria pomeroyi]MCE8527685.1 Hint domain-containing protein [Ruegeria pomeroyi]MCE8546241.1 Hint domain-containing protein [Ruegeria pomeroyi]